MDKMKQQEYHKRRYDRLFRYMGEPVFIIDASGTVLDTNEKAFSLFNQPALGKNFRELFQGAHPDLASLIAAGIVQSIHGLAATFRMKEHPFLLTFVPISEQELMVIGQDMGEVASCRAEVEHLRERVHTLVEEKKLSSPGKTGKRRVSSLAQTMKKLERVNLKLEEVNRNLTRELELAALLQKSLIPQRIVDNRFLQFAFHYEPMEIVGGDYYDVIDFGASRKGVFIADVSGHGVSSAFIAAMMKISFLNYSANQPSPAALMEKLNQEYCNVIQTGDYVTAFYGIFDCKCNSLRYCGAGHPRPMVFQSRTKEVVFLDSEGFFIGMLDDAQYTDESIDFHEGDRYIVFTDGIVEAYSDERKEQFGEHRLRESFRCHSEKPVDQMISSIVMDVKAFMHKSRFYDDLAIIAVEYRKR